MLCGGWIWERAVRIADVMRAAWRKSTVAYVLALPQIDLPMRPRAGACVRGMMRAVEQSRILLVLSRFGKGILQTATATVGLYCFFSGVLLGMCAVTRYGGSFKAIFCAFCLIVSAFPLLGNMKPLAASLMGSIVLSVFLRDWCGFWIDRTQLEQKGRLRSSGALLAAFLTAFAAWQLSPQVLCTALLCILIGALLLAVPELHAVLILFVFPWLRLLEHPTVILSILSLSFFISYICKVSLGRRVPSLSYVDGAALLLSLQWILSAVGGKGSARDVAVATVLTLVWFPMRQTLSLHCWQNRCIGAASLSCTGVSLYGICQYALGLSELKWVDTSRFFDIGGRVTSVFDNPNILAVYLLLHFPLLLCAAVDRARARHTRCAYWFASAVCTLCLILTWTRGAWLGWIAELLLFLICYSRTSLAAGIVMLPFAAFALPMLPQSVKHRFISIGSVADTSARYRINTWQGVLRMIRAHPCGIGVGEAAFVEVYPRYAVSGTERVMHAHQLFLQVSAELGVGGLLTFLIFLTLVLLCGVQGGIQNGGMLALLGGLVMGLFDHLWYYRGMLVLFFSICALCACGKEESVWNSRPKSLGTLPHWTGSF